MPFFAPNEESYDGGLIGMLENVHDVMNDEAESLFDQLCGQEQQSVPQCAEQILNLATCGSSDELLASKSKWRLD